MHVVRIGTRVLQAVLLVLVAAFGAPVLSESLSAAALVQDSEGNDPAEGTEDGGAESAIETEGGTLSVRIEAGACDTRDANTAPIPLSGAVAVGLTAAGEAYTSETEIPFPLSDLLAHPHAIAIDLDDAELAIPIACAAVAGNVVGGKLVIGLLAADTGALTGIAVLGETNGGTTTLVQAYLMLAADTGGDDDGEDDEVEEDTVDGEGGV